MNFQPTTNSSPMLDRSSVLAKVLDTSITYKTSHAKSLPTNKMNFQPKTTNSSPSLDRRNILSKVLDADSTFKYKRFSGLGIRYHDVQAEDTLESVCKQYGISESALREANFGMRKTLSSGNKRIIIPAREKNQEQDAAQGDGPVCKDQDVRDDASSVGFVTASMRLVAI